MKKVQSIKFKTQNFRPGRDGFTMLEVLLYLGIFSMLIIVLFQLLVSILDVQLESQGVSGIDQDGLYIINRLTHDIHRATSVSTPAAGLTNSALSFSINGDTFTYSIASKSLTLSASASGTIDQLNSFQTDVSDLTFERRTDTKGRNFETITLAFTLTSTTSKRKGPSIRSFKTTIGTRALNR